MRIKLLIATGDSDYAEHLSGRISQQHADAFDVSVCRELERLREMLKDRKYDVALIEPAFVAGTELQSINMPLMLWSEEVNAEEVPGELKQIRKYQRISSLASSILESYSKVYTGGRGCDSGKAQITVVWSPTGGVGKTTVALAYAARRAAERKQVLYLNLEPFSSTPAYFADIGKSISAVFEMIESKDGDVRMLICGIRRQDSSTGIAYFCRPENYDDMNILSPDNVEVLIDACAGVTEELVIDMSSVCDERTRKAFELADRILLVTDSTAAAQNKISQFISQHNVFEHISEKAILVANKGAAVSEPQISTLIPLPLVQSTDASVVFNSLSNRIEI